MAEPVGWIQHLVLSLNQMPYSR